MIVGNRQLRYIAVRPRRKFVNKNGKKECFEGELILEIITTCRGNLSKRYEWIQDIVVLIRTESNAVYLVAL